jgi:uncharacterized RDD family membrane protein YckC
MIRRPGARCVVFLLIALAICIVTPLVVMAQEEEPHRPSPYLTTILSWLPMVVLIVLWVYFMRVIRKTQSQSLGKLDKTSEHMGEVAKQLERIATALERRSE